MQCLLSTVITIEEHNKVVQVLKECKTKLETENKLLKEQMSLLLHKLFGRKSEKQTDEVIQNVLFANEVIELCDTKEDTQGTQTVSGYTRKKGGKRPLPANLPRIEKIIDLTEEEKVCGCGKCKARRIGEEISERLEMEPAKIFVLQTIRYKYAFDPCECMNSPIKVAPLPPQIIPYGIATPSLLAHIVTSKFVDALPLYRQEKMFARYGIELSRADMSNWLIYLDENYLQRFVYRFWTHLKSGGMIHIDETTFQVLGELGRKNTTKSYMWVFRGGTKEKPAIIFEYHTTRNGNFMKEIFQDYQGYVMTDGYEEYNRIIEMFPLVILANCMAHARRYFDESTRINENGIKVYSETCKQILELIGNLYFIEKVCKENELSNDEIKAVREEKSKPILDNLHSILVTEQPKYPPSSNMAKAINYSLNRWDKLNVYLQDGKIPIDNNWGENAIRPYVIGRKNWLFSAGPRGADAYASFYSIVESAKANGHEPYWYGRYLFEMLPFIRTNEELDSLLPWVVTPETVKAYFANRGS